MKRLLCAAACLLLALPCHAMAAPARMPYDTRLCLSYGALSQQQQALFDLMYDALANGEEKITLPQHTRYDDAARVMHTLLRDCPELCAVDGAFTLEYYRTAPDEAVGVAVSYTLPLMAQELTVLCARDAVVTDGSSTQRAEALHDWLCSRVTYDENALSSYSAYGALAEGRCVCEGYAEAMALLCRMSGVACSVVSGVALVDGQAMSHSWNMALLDEGYAWIDVTLDDQDPMGRYYFGLTDAQLQTDHAADDSCAGLPACSAAEANWYARNGLLAPEDTSELRAFMYAQFRAMWTEGQPRAMRFSSPEGYAWALENLSQLLYDWQRDDPGWPIGESYRYITVPAQFCITLLP